MPTRDYELTFRVDASQGGPQLQHIRAELVAMRADLMGVATGATAAQNAFAGLGSTATGVMNGAQQTVNSTKHSLLGLNMETLASIAKFKGFEMVIAIMQNVGEQINTQRQNLRDLADDAIKTRDAMRELANLKNKPGPDDATTAGAVKFGMTAGMKPEQAVRFLEQYYGSSPAGLQKGNVGDGRHKNETQEQYEKRVQPLAEEIAAAGARFGQRVGIMPKTAGDITGVLSQHGKVKNAEHASERLGRIAYGLNEGRGNLEPLMRSLANTAGALVEEGIVEDTEQLAVLMGAMSTTHNPQASGTYLKKGVRELRQFNGPQGEGLATMGITPKDDHLAAVRKVDAQMKKDEALGKTRDQSLRDLGFGDEASMQAIIEEVKSLGIVDERMGRQAKISGKQVQAADEKFFNREYAGINMQIDADKTGKDWLTGAKREAWRMAQKAAVQRMRDNGELADGETRIADMIYDAGGILPALGMPKSFEKRINENAYKFLKSEAGTVGLGKEFWEQSTEERKTGGLAGGTKRFDKHLYGQEEPDLFDKLVPKILESGGDPFRVGGTAKKVQERADTNRDGAAAARPQKERPGVVVLPAKGPGGGKNEAQERRERADRDRALKVNPDGTIDIAPRDHPAAAPKPAGPVVPGKPIADAGSMKETNELLRMLVGEAKAQTDEVRTLARGDGALPTFGGFGPRRA